MNSRTYIQAHRGHEHYLDDVQIAKLQKQFVLSRFDPVGFEQAKALSDPTKLRVYLLLKQITEIAVSDIAEIIGVSQSAVSHALSELKKLKFVSSKRCGKLMCYSVEKKVDTPLTVPVQEVKMN